MAQVSYGTITITDTTDLTTYIRYAKQAPLTAASQFQETPTTETHYIAVLSIPSSDTVPVWNSADWKWSEFIGTDGVSVLGTREIYYLKTNSTTVAAPTNGSDISQTSANVVNQWTKNVPTYVTNGEYWTCIQTHLDGSPTWVYGSPVLNQSLTDMNHDIDVIKSVTQQSAEDSQGAMSQAASNINEVKRIWFLKNTSGAPSKPTTSTIIYNDNAANHWTMIRPTVVDYRYYYYCEQTTTGGGIKSWSDVYLDSSELSEYEIGALDTRLKSFFYPGDSNYPGAYAVGKNSSDGLDTTDISTYGYNLRLTPTTLSIGYNAIKAIEIDGATPSLKFYPPSKTTQGTESAILNSNGLTLEKGGIKSGSVNAGNNGFIYLSTQDYGTALTIGNGSGKTDWRAIIGTKFGVDDEGNLYATSANITGAIVATSLDLTTNNVKIGYGSINNTPDLTIYVSKDGVIGTEPSDSAASSSTGFKISSAGLLKAANAVITGKIFATSGVIGGWNIGTDTNKSLYYGNQTPGATTTNLILSPTSATNSNAIGGSGTGLTWFISAGKVFGVTTAGALYSTSGKIGGWSIGTSSIYNGTDSKTSTTTGTYLGTDAIRNYGSSTQYVHIEGGKITAKSVDLSGAITATSGSISNSVTIGGTAASTVVSNAANGATALSRTEVKDTRNDNQNPNWYMSNYPKQVVHEFKTASVIGLSGETYCELDTTVPWGDSSGGYPKQRAIITGKEYWRIGTNGTTWGAWTDATTTATSYITYIDATNGIRVHNASDTNNFAQVNSNGLQIYKGGTAASNKIAEFGSAINLYQPGTTNALVTINSSGASFTGTIHATSGEFNGQITAGSGTIGRWQITSTALKTNSGSTSAGMGAESTYAFWAGNETPASAPFRVGYDGTLTAVEANLSAVKLQDSSGILRAAVGSSGLTLYDSNGSTEIGKFSNNGVVQIGRNDGGHIYMSANNGLQIYNTGSNAPFISVLSDGISFYKNANNKILTISMDSSGTAEINSGTSSNYPYRAFFLFHSEIGMDSIDSSGSSIIECDKNSDGHYISMYTSGDINIQAGSKSKTIELTGRLITSNIDCGSVSVPGASGGGIASAEVSFNKTFASAPKVVITPSTSVPGSTVLGFGIGSVSTTKFTIYVNRINATATTFHWIAIL